MVSIERVPRVQPCLSKTMSLPKARVVPACFARLSRSTTSGWKLVPISRSASAVKSVPTSTTPFFAISRRVSSEAR
jgi:hypothetical protein